MWDQRYATDDYAFGTEPNDFLRAELARLPLGRTLCLGEGEGRNAVFLAAAGHRVTALDGSAVGLDKARRLAQQRGVEIDTLHCDLADYPFEPGHWDAIVSIFCHLPTGLRERVHGSIHDALRPGGVFLIEAYTPEQLEYRTGGPPTLDRIADLDRLEQELVGLNMLYTSKTVREVVEGRCHSGTGAVAQLVAERPLTG